MILCCGEALIDMLPATLADGRRAFVPHAGGAVFNTAIALGRLGAPVGLFTGLSEDLFGRMLAAELAASRVQTDLVVRSARPTTLAFVELADGQARYHFHDENTAGRMLTRADLPDLPATAGALFFGGISLACEPAADAYAALLHRQAGQRVVMIDPNIRPAFIADPARYRARLAGMLARADIVKVSEEDLDWLAPGPAPLADRARALIGQGPQLVVVTRGAAGAVGFHASGAEVAVPPCPAEVVDTVGAGDSFNAGLLACLHAKGLLGRAEIAALSPQELGAAMEFGAKVAAVTVTRAGANPPWAHEL